MHDRPQFKSPLGLAVDDKGERACVALHTAGAVALVDLSAGRVLHESAVGDKPSEVVWVKSALYVAPQEGDLLTVFDPEGLTVRRRVPVTEASGEVLAHLERHRISDRDSAFFLGRGEATNLRAKMSFKELLFLVHQRPRANVPATQVAQGWVFTNALGIALNVPAAPLILDEPQRGHADPSDLAVSPDGKHVFVACAGDDAVLVLDREQMLRFGQPGEYGRRYADEHQRRREDLTASRHYLVARLPTQANPRRLALSGDGRTLVVSNHLADSLTVIDAASLKVTRHISLSGPPPDAVRRGEVMFHSARMTFQGQFTCASCHPNGGSDGLTWDLERDGVGNAKRTKSLLGVKDTAPYGWHGTSATLADRVAGTLRTLHRHEPSDTQVADLAAYLEGLAPSKPLAVKATSGRAVERGQAIFQGKGLCVNCHHRAGLDDGKSHDVGTGDLAGPVERIDTPALRGVSQSKSFLHDGRAKSLEEVFTTYNPRRRHGAAHQLNEEELADLLIYLKSL